MSDARVGLMLYSVRQASAADLEGTLRAVAAIGFEGVEIFDLHGHHPAQVAGWLDELGLVAVARHSQLGPIESNLEGLAAEARELGWQRLVVSYVEPANLTDDTLDRIAVAATAAAGSGSSSATTTTTPRSRRGSSTACLPTCSSSSTRGGPGMRASTRSNCSAVGRSCTSRTCARAAGASSAPSATAGWGTNASRRPRSTRASSG